MFVKISAISIKTKEESLNSEGYEQYNPFHLDSSLEELVKRTPFPHFDTRFGESFGRLQARRMLVNRNTITLSE